MIVNRPTIKFHWLNTQIKSLKNIRRKPPRNFKCCKMSTTSWEMEIVEPSIILEENLTRKTILSSIFGPGNQMTARFILLCGWIVMDCFITISLQQFKNFSEIKTSMYITSTMSNKSCSHLVSWAKHLPPKS